jgi:Ribbon-helix-helix protein, copG family
VCLSVQTARRVCASSKGCRPAPDPFRTSAEGVGIPALRHRLQAARPGRDRWASDCCCLASPLLDVPAAMTSRARLTSNRTGRTFLQLRSYVANPMRTVSFELPESLDDALTDLAKARRSSRSAVVREALESLAKAKRRSVTALAGNLVGSLDGPSDLATDPKHMSGYGK